MTPWPSRRRCCFDPERKLIAPVSHRGVSAGGTARQEKAEGQARSEERSENASHGAWGDPGHDASLGLKSRRPTRCLPKYYYYHTRAGMSLPERLLRGRLHMCFRGTPLWPFSFLLVPFISGLPFNDFGRVGCDRCQDRHVSLLLWILNRAS